MLEQRQRRERERMMEMLAARMFPPASPMQSPPVVVLSFA